MRKKSRTVEKETGAARKKFSIVKKESKAFTNKSRSVK